MKHKKNTDTGNPLAAGYNRLIKRYYRLIAILTIVLVILGAVTFINIDYLIFKIIVSAGYAYTETLDEIFAESIGEANFKGYFRDFDRVVISVLTKKIRESGDDNYTYLYTPQSYSESRAATKSEAAAAEIIELNPETVYIRIPNISKYSRRYFFDNKELLKGYGNIVLDLRSNLGGMLEDYYKISKLFLERGTVIGYEHVRPEFLSRVITANSGGYFEFNNIVILQNGETASAAEGLIMSLKENLSNVTLVGERTFGKGIGQITVPLTFGYAVKQTAFKLGTPSGGSIHLTGIEPDIEYMGDDIIEFTLGLISRLPQQST